MPAEAALAPAIFVTGTDTGVGKTLVGAALALHLRQLGLRVGVMKPVETGVEDSSRMGRDAALLRWAAGLEQAEQSCAPYRFAPPLAPSLAAAKAGVRIDIQQLVEISRELRRDHDFVIVEGAGGLMAPLAGGLLMADLARFMDLPLLVVCRPDLGTINHSMLTVFAARTLNLDVAGYLINNMPAEPDEAMREAPHALASLMSADLLGVLAQVAGEDDAMVEALARQLPQLPTYALLRHHLGWRKTSEQL